MTQRLIDPTLLEGLLHIFELSFKVDDSIERERERLLKPNRGISNADWLAKSLRTAERKTRLVVIVVEDLFVRQHAHTAHTHTAAAVTYARSHAHTRRGDESGSSRTYKI